MSHWMVHFAVVRSHFNIMEVKSPEMDLSDCEEEIIEEEFIHVVMDNAEEDMSNPIVNPNSNVRIIAIDSDSPALQIENKVCTRFFICYILVFITSNPKSLNIKYGHT